MIFPQSGKEVLFGYPSLFGFYQLCMSVKSQNSFMDMLRNDGTIMDIYSESKFENGQTAIPFMSSNALLNRVATNAYCIALSKNPPNHLHRIDRVDEEYSQVSW